MRIIKTFFSVEFLFALFLFAGYFKTIFTFIPIDLTILLLIATFVLAMIKMYKGKKIKTTWIIMWLVFIALATISLFNAPYMPIAVDKYIRLAVISTWCFVGPFLIFDDKEGLKRFTYGVLFLGVLMGLSSFFTNQNAAGFVDVFGSNYQALSRISGSTSLVLLGIFLFSNKNIKIRLTSLLASVVLIMPMLMSGGRLTAVIYLILLLVVFPLMFFDINLRKGSFRIYKRIYAYVITIVAIVSTFFIGGRLGFLETFIFRVQVMFKEEGGGSSIMGRTDRMSVSWDMIQQSPLIGNGLGSFGMNYNSGLLTDTPHNIFLEIASEMGIIALIVFSIIFIAGLISAYRVWRNNKSDWIYTSIYILSIFWIVSAVISSGLTSGKILFAFLGIAITAYSIYKKNTQEYLKETSQ